MCKHPSRLKNRKAKFRCTSIYYGLQDQAGAELKRRTTGNRRPGKNPPHGPQACTGKTTRECTGIDGGYFRCNITNSDNLQIPFGEGLDDLFRGAETAVIPPRSGVYDEARYHTRTIKNNRRRAHEKTRFINSFAPASSRSPW